MAEQMTLDLPEPEKLPYLDWYLMREAELETEGRLAGLCALQRNWVVSAGWSDYYLGSKGKHND
ncbi:hypothetical protein [Alloalcanivorax xenomutans]|uniref:hypothetical protein n=1 Tax=Alloalcanivorax xenomutans TaxID=1094342 RepID=UPI003C4FFC2F